MQVHIIDADTGAEAQNADFLTLKGLSFEHTKKRWVGGRCEWQWAAQRLQTVARGKAGREGM